MGPGLLFVCQSELSEFFGELTELAQIGIMSLWVIWRTVKKEKATDDCVIPTMLVRFLSHLECQRVTAWFVFIFGRSLALRLKVKKSARV